jgi:hypothetical protein
MLCIKSGTRVDPLQVKPLGEVLSKARKKKKVNSNVHALMGMAAITRWGHCTLMSECKGGWNVNYGDGKMWFLESKELTIV